MGNLSEASRVVERVLLFRKHHSLPASLAMLSRVSSYLSDSPFSGSSPGPSIFTPKHTDLRPSPTPTLTHPAPLVPVSQLWDAEVPHSTGELFLGAPDTQDPIPDTELIFFSPKPIPLLL